MKSLEGILEVNNETWVFLYATPDGWRIEHEHGLFRISGFEDLEHIVQYCKTNLNATRLRLVDRNGNHFERFMENLL